MTLEELKKLDRRIHEIPYPFGKNYPLFHRVFSETAQQLGISVSDVIRQYITWRRVRK